MKSIILIITLFILFSCQQQPKKLDITRMKITVEIIPEFGNGGYALSWKDTLYAAQFPNKPSFLSKRPQELYCYILNEENDTLGYYRGLSSPRQFTYFQTTKNTDSIVNIRFSVGINHFSEFLAEQSEQYIAKFNENAKERIDFKPIRVNLKTDLNREIEFVLLNNN